LQLDHQAYIIWRIHLVYSFPSQSLWSVKWSFLSSCKEHGLALV